MDIQATTELLTRAMTAPSRSGLVQLTPVAETVPVMWYIAGPWSATLDGYTPGLLGADSKGSAGTKASDNIEPGQRRLDYARGGLTGLIATILATTKKPAAGESHTSRDIKRWSTLIVTLSRTVFEQPLLKSGTGANLTAINVTCTTLLRYMADAAASVRRGDNIDMNTLEYNARAKAVANELGLPTPGDLTAAQVTLIATRDPVLENAAVYGLVVYMAGRVINNYTSDAVRVRRPKNLFDKFNSGVPWATVGGDLTISEGSYTMISHVWSINPTLRMSLLTPLIGLNEGEAQTTGNVIFTLFKMLRYAGMAHVEIIQNFITRYPYVHKLPELQGELRLLHNHAQALMQVPAHLRAYYKLLYSDGSALFDSKRFKQLSGLAVDIIAETETTLSRYVHTTDNDLLTRFRALRQIEEPTEDEEQD